jgi:hypothetical protein
MENKPCHERFVFPCSYGVTQMVRGSSNQSLCFMNYIIHLHRSSLLFGLVYPEMTDHTKATICKVSRLKACPNDSLCDIMTRELCSHFVLGGMGIEAFSGTEWRAEVAKFRTTNHASHLLPFFACRWVTKRQSARCCSTSMPPRLAIV